MKVKILVWVSCVSLLCICSFAYSVQEYRTNEEEAKAYNVTRVIKTVDGLSFTVQEDRPIEKVAGIYKPLDLDSYVTMKFNKLEKNMTDIASSLSGRIDGLLQQVEALSGRVEELTRELSRQRQEQKDSQAQKMEE